MPCALRTLLMLVTSLLLVTQTASASWGSSLLSSSRDDQPPPMDEAIQVSAESDWDNQQLWLRFDLIDQVYLYQHRFSFAFYDHNGNLIDDFDDLVLPEGQPKQDPIFGDVKVYFDQFHLALPLTSVPLTDTYLEVAYQGCLDEILCYPPASKTFTFGNAQQQLASSAAALADNDERQGFLGTLRSEDANAFNQWMADQHLGLVIGLFFIGGLLLAFTPCVFPMVPILSGIIAGEKTPSAGRGFTLGLSYVLGMAIPYTLAGMLVALFGAGMNLQYMLQQPAAIITSSVIFVLLALSMFGLFELQLPARLRDSLANRSGGRRGGLAGAALLGAISALVVSPCVTPILAGALVYVAATGDATTGALSLFSLAMGMGVPLIIFATGGGHLLPRAGFWMEEIKRFFGVVMLGVAIWLLDRIIPAGVTLALYGLLLGLYGIQLGALEPAQEGLSRLKRGLALVLSLYGMVMLVGAFSGGSDPLQPLARSEPSAPRSDSSSVERRGPWLYLQGKQALDQAMTEAREQGTPVMVDFFAEWCVACVVLEETTLSDPDVLATMADLQLIRVDITDITAENQAIMADYQIIGLPTLAFYNQHGEEIDNARVLGEMSAENFIRHLQRRVLSRLTPDDN